MKKNDMSIKEKLIIYIAVSVFLVLAISTAVSISNVTIQQRELAYLQSVEMARDYANQFDGDMKANMAIAETLARTMEMYTAADREEVNKILENVLKSYPSLTGVYVGYEPNGFDGKDNEYINAYAHDSTGRFIPYWNTIQGHIEVEPLVNYDKQDYYQIPKATHEDVVTEPYFYQGIFMVSLDAPIFKDDKFVGIAGVDVSLDYIDDVISDLKAFDTGYAFVTGNTGILVSHPKYKEKIGTKTLYDFNTPEISTAADDIRIGKGGSVETIDPATGKEVIMFYEPVKTGNYSFVLVVPKEEMFAGVTNLRNKLIVISIISILFMGLVSYLIATSITSPIDEIVNNFKIIAQDVVNGNLDTKAQTDVEIDFKEIPIGLNMILNAVIAPIRETMRVTNALAAGELETRTRLELKGEFKQLGDTLDEFAGSLNNIIADSNRVLTAIQNNNFSCNVQVHGEGDFKILTGGIEKTRNSLDMAIHEQRRVEKELKSYTKKLKRSNELKEEMENIINNSPVIVFKWKAEEDWPVEFVSDNVVQLGYTVEDFTSNRINYADIVHPDDVGRVYSDISQHYIESDVKLNYEYRIFTKTGELRWVEEKTFIRCDQAGRNTLQGVILDITERKKVEEALLETEKIRKKEIHHRVKNNLQVISSLLYLASENFKDPQIIEAFMDSRNRVRSMALIHEKLYQSSDVSNIDFSDYTENLLKSLLKSYQIENKNIKFVSSIKDVYLNIDTAVPLGIIINELVSNSLKHAFPEMENGQINVELKVVQDNFLLKVKDNGIGLPPEIDYRNTESLGLQLVVTLVDQIDGTIELNTTDGTEFSIIFKEKK
ncbi:MAG: histidine kinase dimerization/phosphoacceptor domain -containing protein [Methanolobus sp.]|jgi:PAS domain S-box-containing protein|nr:histidine kinase dimerization/phosphoacceptor domain -containing protein [Methanolobus sp.]